MYRTSSALALGLLPMGAFAHPGEHHMSVSAAIAHFASQPDHLGMLLLVIAGAVTLAVRMYRKN